MIIPILLTAVIYLLTKLQYEEMTMAHEGTTTPFKDGGLTFTNASIIRFASPGKFHLIESGEELLLDEADKPCFANIDDVAYLLPPGQFVEILPMQRHQVFSVGAEPLQLMVKCSPSWVFEDQHLVDDVEKARVLAL